MKTIRLTMAQALVQFLDNQYIERDGVTTKFIEGIFGIFGHGNVTGLGEALENTQHDLIFIQGHNEQGMVHAATAFAKQHQRLKIMACTSSIGPGATNMVTGAATATTNRIPVLLLPGDIFACRQPDPVLQQLEHPMDATLSVNDCLKPVSAYWDRLMRPEQLMSACLNAMRVLTSPEHTGAVTLCLPQDAQAEAYDYPVSFFTQKVHVIDRVIPTRRSLELAVEKLLTAKAPLIIAGGGVAYSQAGETLKEFAHTFKIPMSFTQAGKGCVSDDDIYSVGGLGVTGTQVANQLAHQADVVLAVGTRLSDFTTASKSAFSSQAQIVHINVNTRDGHKLNGVCLTSDAQEGLKALGAQLKQHHFQTCAEFQSRLSDLQSTWALERSRVISQKGEKLSQCAVLGLINEFVDKDNVVIGAAGSLPGDLHRLWHVKNPGTYHLEYAYSCMGYEVAGGLGAKLAHPLREVYVLVGDGSYLMMHSELFTSLQHNIKINIIVFDNQGYRCIRNLQKSQGSQGFANEFTQPVNFAQMASSMGVSSYQAHDLESCLVALKQAKANETSTLIDIKVSPDSMSHGYDTWWRVDVAQHSNAQEVQLACENMREKISKAMPY